MSKRPGNESASHSGIPKKRARFLVQPDGFSTSASKSTARLSAPKFITSAFNDPALAPSKRPTRLGEVQSDPVFVNSDAPNPPKLNRTMRPLKPLKPPVPLFNSEFNHVNHSTPAPRLPPLPICAPPPKKKATLHRLFPPPASIASSSKTIFPPSVSMNAPLRQLPAPPAPSALVASSSKPTTPLKPLAPPPLAPTKAVPSDRALRTISTTLIARANDLFTDNGVSELASILLHDQHPDIQYRSTPEDVDERRGIMMSPEKRTKGKEKFARDGLAARAAAMYDRSDASLSLWEAEMAHALSSMAPSSRRGLNPDMRLRIVHILHVPTPVPNPSSKVSIPGVALCHLLAAPSSDPLGSSKSKDALCVVLFSFSSLSPPVQPHAQTIRNPEDFAEGREVYVWKPWQCIVIDPSAIELGRYSPSVPDGNVNAGAVDAEAFELFAPGVTGARRRGVILETALIFERFIVLK